MSSLTPDEIAALLKVPDAKPRTRSGGTRVKKDATLDRSLDNWFKLKHDKKHTCENPNCYDHTRQPDNKGRWTTIQVKVDGQDMYICRYCFLAKVGLPDDGA